MEDVLDLPFGFLEDERSRRVITDFDKDRKSWHPTDATPEEETAFLENLRNTVDAAYLDYNATCGLPDKVQQLLRDDAQRGIPLETRCPFGWRAWGPLCVALSLVPPYTECPVVKRRFNIGVGNRLLPLDGMPGLCEHVFETGVSFRCPAGADLRMQLYGIDKEQVFCSRQVEAGDGDTVRRKAAGTAGATIAGFGGLAYSTPGTETLVANSGAADLEDVSHDTRERITPLPTCPEQYTLDSYVYDEFAWNGKEKLVCNKAVRVKGRAWCPHGYEVTFEEWPDLRFGSVVPSDATGDTLAGAGRRRETNAKLRSLIETGFFDRANVEVPESVRCFQVLAAVARTSCDRLKCRTAMGEKLRHELIAWGYKLEIDPDYVAAMGLMGGRDAMRTTSGIKKNFS